jgi:dihydroorotate dehydrogenase electron transfer subunit
LDISSERTRIRRVIRNVKENRSITSVYFKDEECSSAKPGQFVMLWEPGFDEFPMSLSNYDEQGVCSVTAKPWGPGSNELVRAKRGDVIGIRGPYGHPFTCSSAGGPGWRRCFRSPGLFFGRAARSPW